MKLNRKKLNKKLNFLKVFHKFIHFTHSIEKTLIDFIFPKNCLFCEKENTFFCSSCQKKVSLLSFLVCPFCEKTITSRGEPCALCKETPLAQETKLSQLIVATSYQDSFIQTSIHFFKYKFIKELAFPLANILAKSLIKNLQFIPELIIPVPLHPWRLRWRGFNQSQVLAEIISTRITPPFQIPVDCCLIKRTQYNPPQMSINKKELRWKNVKGIFKVNPQDYPQIKNKKILLVDDICTSGATLLECSKELKKASPSKIAAAVIARQGF